VAYEQRLLAIKLDSGLKDEKKALGDDASLAGVGLDAATLTGTNEPGTPSAKPSALACESWRLGPDRGALTRGFRQKSDSSAVEGRQFFTFHEMSLFPPDARAERIDWEELCGDFLFVRSV